MKATLEFNLPEERDEHLQAVMAGRLWCDLGEVAQLLRSHYKHGVDATKTLTAIQDVVNAAMEDAA
jgi:hypothetical protein